MAAVGVRRATSGRHRRTPGRTASWHNCSGKHAAMLAATVASGWDPARYLDPAHPLQARITDSIRDVAGPVDPIGVDGCGAPVFATTARGMGRAFARLSVGRRVSRESSTPCMPSLRWFRASATSMPPLPPISMRSPSEARPAPSGSGCEDSSGLAVKVWGGSGLVAGVAGLAALDQLGALTPYARERLAKALASRRQGRRATGGKIRATLGVAMAMTHLDRFPDEGFDLSPLAPRVGPFPLAGFLRGLVGGDSNPRPG